MREYIVPVGNTDKDYEEMFIGFIRKRQELIRCKDCAWRYFSHVSGEHYCFEFNAPVTDTDFCSMAKREEE